MPGLRGAVPHTALTKSSFSWAPGEAAPQTDEMRVAELGDLECGSEQVDNNLARSAGSSCRFGIPS